MKRNEAKFLAMQQGNPKFFDGKPCKKGHISERYTRNSGCVQCAFEEKALNKDYAKAYAAKNKEKISKYQQDYRQANKERLSKLQAEYRQENLERLTEYGKSYHVKNADKIRKRTKDWAKANPEKALQNSRISQATRRARKSKATPLWANMKKIRQIYLDCPKGMEVDHIIPLAGKKVCGLHVENNLQYLDPDTNRTKAASFVI